MCLIAAIPAGKSLSMEVCKRAAQSNPDGWGLAWIHKGALRVCKEMHSLKRFQKRVRRACRSGSPVLVHFRYATHGSVCPDNTHPIVVDEQTAVAHNGILHGYGLDEMSDMSDTAEFVRTVLRKYPVAMQTVEGRDWLGKLIGRGNKLAFLSVAEGLSIVNEAEGIWDGGIWYSNCGYKPRLPLPWSGRYFPATPATACNMRGWYDDPYDTDGYDDDARQVTGWVVPHDVLLCDSCLVDNPDLADTAQRYEPEKIAQEYCLFCNAPLRGCETDEEWEFAEGSEQDAVV